MLLVVSTGSSWAAGPPLHGTHWGFPFLSPVGVAFPNGEAAAPLEAEVEESAQRPSCPLARGKKKAGWGSRG